MLVLDTDHVSALGLPSQVGLRLLERIAASGGEAATTVVTVEEQLRGWLAEIHRLPDPHRQVVAYERLQQRIDFFASWTVLPWNGDAAGRFVRLRHEGVRIGSMDLKIACIALAHAGTLLTRNTADFSKVPGLQCENWLM
ncbi:MAG: type II toxin-antitoxin system VapC family toxin [Limisphaerales bacterium]